MARDLYLFYLFRLLATSYLFVPVSVLFPQSRGLSFGEVMMLSALYSLVVIVVEVPTGAMADRIGRKHSLIAGALAMVISGILAYVAQSLAMFAASIVLAAISMALCSGADSAYLFDLLHAHGRGHEYPRLESISSAWHQAGSAMACAAGGLLGDIDLALPYLATSVVAGLALVVALMMRPERKAAAVRRAPEMRSELASYWRHMSHSVRDVAGSRNLSWIIAYSAVVFMLVRSTEYLYQPYLNERGFSVTAIGLVFALQFLLASFVAHRADALRLWLGEELLVYGLLGMLSLSFFLLGQVHGAWAPLSMLAVQGVAMGLFSPLVKTMLNRQIPDSSRRATILSVESIARRCAKGLFSPVAGYVGAASAMYLCGGIGFVGFIVLAVIAAKALTALDGAAVTSRAPGRARQPSSD